MYGLAGQRYLPERELTWLTGYENSKPVRIGNAASEQLQLDIYGEVMAAFHSALSRLGKAESCRLPCFVAWSSIWKPSGRSPTRAFGKRAEDGRHFTYSKVMAWVAFDRAIKAAGAVACRCPGGKMAEGADKDSR